MNEYFKQPRSWLIILLALVVAGVAVIALEGDSSDDTASGTDSDAPSEQVNQDEQPNDEDNQDEEQDNTPEEEPKTPPANILNEPVVFTGFGHSSSNPLKQGQNTSTTCTTDAQVICVITFTNQDNRQTVTFDEITTNSQGVARWEWTGGKDVPSGTWRVVATAGDKSSDAETIYIQ